MHFRKPLLAALAACALAGAAQAGETLTAQEIRKLAPGRYAVNVMGLVNMTVSMRPNGVITGQAKGEQDRGSWTVRGEMLCISWNKWAGGKLRCAALRGDNGSYQGGGLSIRKI